jgi:hypothetical protein
VLAVAFGGSNAFTCPMGHQVNLMVMGPGGYKYRDYLRFGVPLGLIRLGARDARALAAVPALTAAFRAVRRAR